MPNLPAFCDNCGTMFPSGFAGSNTSIRTSNVKSGPCPNCGGMGSVPDGLHTIIGNTIKILNSSNRSLMELRQIVESLENLRGQDKPFDSITEELKKELPELSNLADIFPKTRAELYPFIAVIVAIIGLLIAGYGKKEETKIEIHNVINNINANNQSATIYQQKFSDSQRKKFGVNEPCYCGSGTKYKKCHGAK